MRHPKTTPLLLSAALLFTGCGGVGYAHSDRATGGAAMPAPPMEEPASAQHETDYGVNPWTDTAEDNLSTFAVDVDTASYSRARRDLLEGRRPSEASVRVEEFVNYFRYDYPQPDADMPFSVDFEAAPSPFQPEHHLLRIGVQGRAVPDEARKPANLVFLVDVSGSMSAADKLGLAKRAMHLLVDNLNPGDSVSLVTYAGNTRVVLEPTGMERAGAIHAAIEDLNSGGGTAMSDGMTLAYDLAARGVQPGAISRVIVLSDGDANIGASDHDSMLEQIAEHVEAGVTMSTIGLGNGNYNDTNMEQLANKGNGNYAYIGSWSDAKRVFSEQLGGTLEVIARDVKIQVEFDPAKVTRYRLIGYENRDIADADFTNDAVDAGEIGAGHSVTALYEVAFQEGALDDAADLATVRLRYKQPEGDDPAQQSTFSFDARSLHPDFAQASPDFRFTVSVAAFAEHLRASPDAPALDDIHTVARSATAANDPAPERAELITLIERATSLTP